VVDQFTSIALFVAAVEEGSLVAAGRRFGLSSSMAGKHVKALEASLDVSLLQRSTRHLNLTDAGRAYYERCKLILADLADANREASDSNTAIRGALKVAAPVSFGAMYLGDVVARYLDAHPLTTVELLLSDECVDLLSQSVDVSVQIGRMPGAEAIWKDIGHCAMVLCASPAFIERHGMPRTIDDVRREPKLSFNEASVAGKWAIIDAGGTAHEVSGPFRMVANNAQMLLASALESAGVAYGPDFLFRAAIASGDLVQILANCRMLDLGIHAVYPAARHVSAKVYGFIEYLSQEFAQSPPWEKAR